LKLCQKNLPKHALFKDASVKSAKICAFQGRFGAQTTRLIISEDDANENIKMINLVKKERVKK